MPEKPSPKRIQPISVTFGGACAGPAPSSCGPQTVPREMAVFDHVADAASDVTGAYERVSALYGVVFGYQFDDGETDAGEPMSGAAAQMMRTLAYSGRQARAIVNMTNQIHGRILGRSEG